jgi:prenyltransferase beta subunit
MADTAPLLAVERAITVGAASLPVEVISGCRAAVLAHQGEDGGFRGRAGGSNGWYTDFAVRVLALAGGADASLQRASTWLSAPREPPRDAVAALDQVQTALRLAAAGQRAMIDPVAALRTVMAQRVTGGGFAHPGTAETSAYQTFVADCVLELLGRGLPDWRDAVSKVSALQRADDGFADRPGDGTGQTNATAAALAFLAMHESLTEEMRERAVAFLTRAQTPDGGLNAHPGLDRGDLLSTFSGLWTLAAIDSLDRLRLGDVARFVSGLRLDAGGFRAGLADVETDPEYTSHGLCVLALLHQHAAGGTPSPAGGLLDRISRSRLARRAYWLAVGR